MLFPLRLVIFLANIAITALILLPILLLNEAGSGAMGVQEIVDAIFVVHVRIALFSIGFIVRHHGAKPQPKQAHIFVSNHTSVMDYALASSTGRVHAVVAQGHGGVFGAVQRLILHPLTGSLTFDRNEARDRVLVTRRMKSHVHNTQNKPLLIFPEGTCVNNEYTVLFHKGAFELDCLVCPIAIKYSKYYGDPYFNTREQTFTAHLVYLMTRWCMIADVYWIEGQQRGESESHVDFADRVKDMISARAKLKNLSWDGYLKNYRPSAEKQDKMRSKTKEEYERELRRKVDSLRQVSISAGCSAIPSGSSTPVQLNAAASYQLPGWLSDESRTNIQNAIIRSSLQEPSRLLSVNRCDQAESSLLKVSQPEKLMALKQEMLAAWESVASLGASMEGADREPYSDGAESIPEPGESTIFDMN